MLVVVVVVEAAPKRPGLLGVRLTRSSDLTTGRNWRGVAWVWEAGNYNIEMSAVG